MNQLAGSTRWPRLAALGVMLYAGFLVATAPAAVLPWALERVTQGAVTLESPQGGLWRGRAAALVVHRPGIAPQRLRELTWQVLPSRLLRGQLAAALALNDERIRGSATVHLQRASLRLSDSAFTVSAAFIPALFPAAQLVRPGGVLRARADSLTLARDAFTGQAELEWTDASSVLSTISPLGTYRAQVKSEGALVNIEVTTLRGALQIEGRGSWSPKAGTMFSGTARAQPANAGELRDLLRLLGPEDAGGVFRMRWGST